MRKDPVKDMTELIQALDSELITVEQAIERQKEIRGKGKSWGLSFWREQRKGLIKDSCERCGSTKQPLVLQHLWHPKRLDFYAQKITWQEWKQNHPVTPDEELPTRKACIGCGSINQRLNKTTKVVTCSKCKAINPETVDVPDMKARAAIKQSIWTAYCQYMATPVQPTKVQVMAWIQDNLDYLSCSDAKTWCKRCAWAHDRGKLI